MKKNKKTIIGALGATALGAGVITAAVAQACAGSGTSESDAARQTVVQNAVRALNGVISRPNNDDNQDFFFDAFQEIITTDNASAAINLITIDDPATNVIASSNGSSVTIAQNSIRIRTDQAVVYLNIDSALTISNITFSGENITAVGNVEGLNSRTNQEIALEGFIALNGIGTTIPTDATQLTFFNALQNAILGISGGQIQDIQITEPATNVTSNTNGTILFVAQNALKIITVNGNVDTYINSSTFLNIVGLDYTNEQLDSVDAITGLVPQTSTIIAENTFRNLDGVSTRPTEGTSEQVFYDAILQEIQSLNTSGITAIRIGITNPIDHVNAINNGASVTVDQNEIFIATTGGDGLQYANTNAMLVLNSLTFANGRVASVGNIAGIEVRASNQVLAQNAFRALNGVSSEPAVDTSERVFYNGILTAIQQLDGGVTAVDITILNPTTNVVANAAGTMITVTINTLTVVSIGGSAFTYINDRADTPITEITFKNNLVSTVNTANKFDSQQQMSARDSLIALNGTVAPTSGGELILYNAIFANLEMFDQGITGISNITISNPSMNVLVVADGSIINVLLGRIIIVTTGGGARTYANNGAILAIMGITFTAGFEIASVGSIDGFSAL